jgi:valyl-tRNA synthetase
LLDTWFSSSLVPFSSFGWPTETDDFKKFFPTTLLETGHDILLFSAARMVIISLELTDRLPFTQIYLHPVVEGASERKMSQSLGNVINSLNLIHDLSPGQRRTAGTGWIRCISGAFHWNAPEAHRKMEAVFQPELSRIFPL